MIAGFDHIAISTKNVRQSIEFYENQFDDVEILYQDSTWGYIKCCGIKIALVTETEHPPHICFRVGSKAALFEFASKTGAKIVMHRDRTESFYLYDSSGNAIEIIWYPE